MTANKLKLEIQAFSKNVTLARAAAASFLTLYDPNIAELTDIKTAVSEAVTNAVIHGYAENGDIVTMEISAENGEISIEISDKGVGIENVKKAMKPLFTTKPETERSGLGFTVMESFMDTIEVISSTGEGTTVRMKKKLGAAE